MAVTRARKEEILQNLEAHLKDAQSVAFTSNQKLTVLEVSKMKKEIRDQKGVYLVAKKTLICKAMKNVLGAEVDIETLPGAVAILICKGDKISPLAVVNKYVTEFRKEEKIKFVGGYIDGRLLSAAESAKLASLPSKEVLLAKLLGSMMSPLSALARFFDGAKNELGTKTLTTVGQLVVAAKEAEKAAPVAAEVATPVATTETVTPAETTTPVVTEDAPAAE